MSKSDWIPLVDSEVGSDAEADAPAFEKWISDELSQVGTNLALKIFELDQLLAELRGLLYMNQPIAPGQIDLRWWKSRRASRSGRDPFPIRWKIARNGEWKMEQIPVRGLSLRGMKKGQFHGTAPRVTIILRLMAEVIAQRDALMIPLGGLKRSLTMRVNNRSEWINEVTEKVDALKVESEADPAVQKLLQGRRNTTV